MHPVVTNPGNSLTGFNLLHNTGLSVAVETLAGR